MSGTAVTGNSAETKLSAPSGETAISRYLPSSLTSIVKTMDDSAAAPPTDFPSANTALADATGRLGLAVTTARLPFTASMPPWLGSSAGASPV